MKFPIKYFSSKYDHIYWRNSWKKTSFFLCSASSIIDVWQGPKHDSDYNCNKKDAIIWHMKSS